MNKLLEIPHEVHESTCYVNGLFDVLAWKGAKYGTTGGGGMAGFEQFGFYDVADYASTEGIIDWMKECAKIAIDNGFPPGKEAAYLEMALSNEELYRELVRSSTRFGDHAREVGRSPKTMTPSCRYFLNFYWRVQFNKRTGLNYIFIPILVQDIPQLVLIRHVNIVLKIWLLSLDTRKLVPLSFL